MSSGFLMYKHLIIINTFTAEIICFFGTIFVQDSSIIK
jgi:hypothetical protein